MTSAGSIVERVGFPTREACLVRVRPDATGGAVVAALDLPTTRPVIVVNGGTDELTSGTNALGRALDAVAALAAEDGATLVTGGTHVGVFAMLGHALAQVGDDYVCVGVAPTRTTTWPGRHLDAPDPAATPLEPHHSHFALIEPGGWGDETALMLALTAAMSRSAPSVAVLLGGGEMAKGELLGHLRAERPVILVKGSGRLADEVAGIVRDPLAAPEGFVEVGRSAHLLDVYDLSHDGEGLRTRLRRQLGGRR